MPRRCSRIASRGLGKQEQPRTQIRVEIPTHAPGLSEQLLASPGRLCHVSTPTLTRLRALECAGVCPRWAQIWAQTQPIPASSRLYAGSPNATASFLSLLPAVSLTGPAGVA